jgi:hypothetical protein
LSNQEDLDEIWKDDLLGDRRQHAEFLERFVVKKAALQQPDHVARRSHVINLNSPWGSGKSFFLERFRRHLERNHVVAFIDAWKFDYVDDPLLPVIDAFQVEFQRYQTKALEDKVEAFKRKAAAIVGAIVAGAAKQAARRMIGNAVDEIAEHFKGENSTAAAAAEAGLNEGLDRLTEAGAVEASGFAVARRLVEDFRDALQELAASIQSIEGKLSPLIVLVDELDRCRPSYAIQMLERIKHLFGVPGVVFILATDTNELQHSIKAIYGQDFDAKTYMRRFFDTAYEFGEPTVLELVRTRMGELGLDENSLSSPFEVDHAQVIADMAIALKVQPRDIKRQLEVLDAAIATRPFETRIALPVFFLTSWAYYSGDQELLAAIQRASRTTSNSTELSRILSDRGLSVTYNGFRYRERVGEETREKLSDAIVNLMAHGAKPLNNLPRIAREQIGEKSAAGWAGDFIVSEAVARRSEARQLANGAHLRSSLTDYLELIRSAGRFTTVYGDDDNQSSDRAS